jgi:hypothetical protein
LSEFFLFNEQTFFASIPLQKFIKEGSLNMNFYKYLFFLIFLSGCSIAPPMQRLDDDAYYSQKGTWNFSSSVDECTSAVKQGIMDLGYQVKRHDRQKQMIVSSRQNILNFKEADRVIEGGKTNILGQKEDMVLKGKSHAYEIQYFLKVTGSKKSCKIELKRLRVFQNGSERDAEALGFINGHVKRLKDAIQMNLQ